MYPNIYILPNEVLTKYFSFIFKIYFKPFWRITLNQSSCLDWIFLLYLRCYVPVSYFCIDSVFFFHAVYRKTYLPHKSGDNCLYYQTFYFLTTWKDRHSKIINKNVSKIIYPPYTSTNWTQAQHSTNFDMTSTYYEVVRSILAISLNQTLALYSTQVMYHL